MGKDFKSYINDNPDLKKEQAKKEKSKNEQPKNSRNKNMNEEEIIDTVKKVTKQYEGKSQQELMGEILKQANQGKKDGSVNLNELEKMTHQIAPMLNSEQQKKLNEIMDMIKKQ